MAIPSRLLRRCAAAGVAAWMALDGGGGMRIVAQELALPARGLSPQGALGNSASGVYLLGPVHFGLSPMGAPSLLGDSGTSFAVASPGHSVSPPLGADAVALPASLAALAESALLAPAAVAEARPPLASVAAARPLQAKPTKDVRSVPAVPANEFGAMLEHLRLPSDVAKVDGAAAPEAFRGASESEFISRLGGEPIAVETLKPGQASHRAIESSRLLPPAVGRSREVGLSAKTTHRVEHRSPVFSGLSALGAGALVAFVHLAGASTAATIGFILTPMMAGYALLELGSYLFVSLGPQVQEKDFWPIAERLIGEMDLHPGLRAALIGHVPGKGLLRPYHPKSRFSASFGFSNGFNIYFRPELARTPFLFKLVLKHELDHYYTSRERAPPSGWKLIRGVGAFWSELRARASDFWPSGWLRELRIPVLERVLVEAGLSMKLAAPFDVLVARHGDEEWEDESVYRALSDGKARVLWSDAAGLFNQIGFQSEEGDTVIKPEHRGRYRSVIAPVQVMATRIGGHGPSRIEDQVSALYDAMRHKGVAFLTSAASAPDSAVIEAALRGWKSADGGQFEVQRVDVAEGGFVLVATKVERRVYLWLPTQRGRAIRESITNVSNNPSDPNNPLGADAVLDDAGYSLEQVRRFKTAGMIVRHRFGSDVLGDDASGFIYVSVLQSRSKHFQALSEAEGIGTLASRAGFSIHLAESLPLQRVPQAHRLRLRGEGMRIYSIDTGVDATHLDLLGTEFYDVVNDGAGDPVDHGSHTQAIARGAHGVAPRSIGRVGRVFSPNRRGGLDGDIMAGAVDAMRWGADVAILALGSPGEVGSPISEFFSNLTRRRNARGAQMVVAASASNDGPFRFGISDPGSGAEVLTSGSSTKRRTVAFFSGVGWAIDRRFFMLRYEDKPDIVPVGGDVVTAPGSDDMYPPGFGIEAAKSKDAPDTASDSADHLRKRESGSSQGAAASAGMTALVLEAIESALASAGTEGVEAGRFFAEQRAFVVRSILSRSAIDLGVPGWHQGHGVPDAEAAVLLALASFGRKPTGIIGRLIAVLKWRSFRAAAALGSEGFEWIRRARELRDLELAIFQKATTAGEVVREPRGKWDASMKAFETMRAQALPRFLTALKDPVWLVRRTAAFCLINLRAPEAMLRPAGAPEDSAYLGEVAFEDPDARVQHVAFEAIGASGRNDAKSVGLLRRAVLEAPDASLPVEPGARSATVLYAAYALARLGDGAGVPRLIEATRNPDPSVRYTGAVLLGELGTRATPAVSEALARVVSNEQEEANARHAAVASLAQIVSDHPDALGDAALMALFRNASARNKALTRTIARFFPIALRQRKLEERFRQAGVIHDAAESFVRLNREQLGKTGSLADLATLLARTLDIPFDSPSALRPEEGDAPGIDPERGPLHGL